MDGPIRIRIRPRMAAALAAAALLAGLLALGAGYACRGGSAAVWSRRPRR